MGRFAIFAAMVAMLVFASPAAAQNSDGTEATIPQSAGQSQYQYDPGGPSTQQAIEQGIEGAVEDARENNAAVDGTEAYVESLSPEEAEASETDVSETEGVEPSASERYENLPDTGGPTSLPFAGAFALFIAGGWIVRRVHTKSD
ncbi:MAG: hypothetical protein M3494_03865 [Actinomycetota bacterium]|jgi:LPXTG-motif cell wall-anchored protein|nr:hypothetical protein [Actinomycetota bacterium]